LTDSGSYPQATAEWVVYQTRRSLWKMPIDGGEPVKLGENMAWSAISPDGKMVACALQVPLPARLALIPIEGGSPARVFDVQPNLPARIHWAPDGRAVTYVALQNGMSDIWSQPIDGGEPKKLTNFKSNRIFSFDWSRDNKLVISHGNSTSNVVLIRNAR
jgi:dipeptidyl aminopeptidase/acylaminoacyl peptidase